MNAEVYRNIAYLSADSPAVEIERWDGVGLRFSENLYLAALGNLYKYRERFLRNS